ncbi:hypothetical protein [Chryseobacterium sp.]|uniref:hypothetical protein n=1 Tax=Chryseobacterium sp. TaxID=1871047 RepID=UPI002896E0B9|nr:hypothetical protein [Chryseobacterium sp.]
MKKLSIFTAILLNNLLFACGFYPYGEDVRFHFLNPDSFGFQNYNMFYYSSASFGDTYFYGENKNSDGKNEEIWRKYCKNKVSAEDIHEVLMHFNINQINSDNSNSFIKYLFLTKDFEAINYLKFAKSCEFFNTWVDDPWERNEKTVIVNRENIINKAILFSENVKSLELRKRYSFLAIRMMFYNNDFKGINRLYNQNYAVEKQDGIIDVWALYFKAIAEQDPALSNIYFAKVFAECPEKRFVSWQYFKSKIPKQEVLKKTKNKAEKSNVLMVYGLYNSGKDLENLKQIYINNPSSEGLSFLLSREINKLEDWVFTPYYTLFDPSMISPYYSDKKIDESESVKTVLQRSESDRKYASEVLQFINSVDLSKVKNPDFWRFAKAELLFMSRKYDESLAQISQLEKSVSGNSKMLENIEQIKALNLLATQKKDGAFISESVKNIILKYKNNRRFVFACGRELEYLGNTDDAAILYASFDKPYSENDYQNFNYVYYKSLKNKKLTYEDYFTDAFNYIDAIYSPEQVSDFIKKAQSLESKTDEFSRYFKLNKSSIQSFYDLLATKYLRQNKLDFALYNFKKLGADFYENQYSAWERNSRNSYFGSVYFDQNPFYQLKYTPDFISEKEAFKLNKISITEKLIEYISKAENPNEKDRDYYYFLVANSYYNMSQFGNVWMMKRYFKGSRNFSVREDDEEFNASKLAAKYYEKAFQYAKTDKFKALCLRMMGRCENNRLDYLYEQNEQYFYKDSLYTEKRLAKNKYYQKLMKEYPKDYENLMSNCDFFESYFKARR